MYHAAQVWLEPAPDGLAVCNHVLNRMNRLRHRASAATTGARTPSTTGPRRCGFAVPAAIAGAGDTAVRRFLEFFAATIRNKITRTAYYRAVTDFFAWVATERRVLRDRAW
jgi:hypothetical protein